MFSFSARGKVADATRKPGFLTRLRRDGRGNTFAIVAAALVPLTAMIGSGVDMSRAYMAKTRLQSACDAAALAGRRVMQNDVLNANVTNEATRFFRYNFPQGLYQTANFNPVVTRPSSGTVQVTASTTIPTAIMHMFGFVNLPLSVTCEASLTLVNTDIVLVLDVTGSMLCTPEESGSCGRTSEISTSRIVALRDAVMALYDELAPMQQQLEANGLRLRYSVVPFSSSVNVGHLIRAANPDYLASNVEYETSVARYDLLTYVGTPDPPEPPVTQVYGSSISQADCDRYGNNVAFSGFTPSATQGGGPAPTPTWTRTYSNDESQGVDWGWSGSDTSGNERSCRRRYVHTVTDTFETRYRWNGTTYRAEDIDVSQYKLGNPLVVSTMGDTLSETDGNVANDGYVATPGEYDARELNVLSNGGNNIGTTSYSWNGCIEERYTVPTITSASGFAIPAEANDLNINLIPTTADSNTQWRPMLPQLTYRRAAGSDSSTSGTQMTSLAAAWWACPSESRRLAIWNRGDMQSYVNALTAVGGTYHDVGMIWGARMISTGGIFADGCETFNGMPCTRHVIYMTDGELSTNNDTYTAYGIEQHDRRITDVSNSTATERNSRHIQRFRMACNATKGMNVSVWVLAFATTTSASMSECASNSNQFFAVANRDQLIQRFREIGTNIGTLRLTQ